VAGAAVLAVHGFPPGDLQGVIGIREGPPFGPQSVEDRADKERERGGEQPNADPVTNAAHHGLTGSQLVHAYRDIGEAVERLNPEVCRPSKLSRRVPAQQSTRNPPNRSVTH